MGFRHSDLDSIINLSLKQAVRQTLHTTMTSQQMQTALTETCVDTLYMYRKRCASHSSSGQLILPEPLKLLPLFTLGLIKNPLLKGGLGADERSFLFSIINSMPCYVSVPFVVPRMYDLLDIPADCCVLQKNGRVTLPKPQTLSIEAIEEDGLYLLDNARFFYLWIGEAFPNEKCKEVFGIERNFEENKRYQYIIQKSDQPDALCSRIHTLINTLRKEKSYFQNLQIIARRSQPDGSESLDEKNFFEHLIEDGSKQKKRGNGRQCFAVNMSYIDFLCWVHKNIQRKLTW